MIKSSLLKTIDILKILHSKGSFTLQRWLWLWLPTIVNYNYNYGFLL